MDFSFFTNNNKSGYKTKESWFSKNHPNEYEKIIQYTKDSNLKSFKEKIWFFYNNLKETPKCSCGKELKFTDRFDRGYQSFCSLGCANSQKDEMVKRQKESIQKKWGVDFFPQHQDFLQKQMETKKKRYGNETYNNVEKMRKTKKTLYGDSGYNNSLKNKITRRESFISTIKEKIVNLNDNFVSYNLEDDNITLNCNKCKTDYQIYNNLFNYRFNNNHTICTVCNEVGVKQQSQGERDLVSWLGKYCVVEEKNRTILNGKEVDAFIPHKNIGIEYHGLYWHSDVFMEKNYHLDKMKSCLANGVNLIQIFEDEWLTKTDIVKSVIKTKLGVFDKTIWARKCKISEISSNDYKSFLNENHLQGEVNSKIKMGLFFNEELISVIGFGSLRKSLGHDSEEGSFELIRFCNKLNHNVIGGFPKLLKSFLKKYSPKKVLTYSDNRYFSGDVYCKNGFDFIGETKPNYFYVKNGKRFNRFSFRKDVLIKMGYDKTKSESVIMKDLGYSRIWDCGNKKWVMLTN